MDLNNKRNTLLDILYLACSKLFLKHLNSILNRVSERNICANLMVEMYPYLKKSSFSKYYIDVEYNRNDGKIKTIINDKLEVTRIECDLIVHSRGENLLQDNLLALEMKKTSSKKVEKDKDRNRLIALTKSSFDDVWSYDGSTLPEHVCRYLVGVYLELDISNEVCFFEVYSDGKLVHSFSKSFTELIEYNSKEL